MWMIRLLRSVLMAGGLATLLAGGANATPILTSFSGSPTTIDEGQWVTFSFSIGINPTPGYYNEHLNGGSLHFESGDGDSFDWNAPFSGTTASGLFSFYYEQPGSYTATVSGSLSSVANYTYTYWYYAGMRSCGFLCTEPVYYLGYGTGTQYFGSSPSAQQLILVNDLAPAPTAAITAPPANLPEPGTLALLSAGLVGLALLRRR